MLTNNELKYYSALLKKKSRQDEKKFIIEGAKLVEEGLNSNYDCEIIIATPEYSNSNSVEIKAYLKKKHRLEIIKAEQFKKLADTESPQGIAGIFKFTSTKINHSVLYDETMLIYLDNISDPGNLGTILRTADWFGLNYILLSPGCVELFNPKVVRSSMGSIFHLNIIEKYNAEKLNGFVDKKFNLIGTDIHGKNIYDYKFHDKFVLIFSNEGNGPSPEIQNLVSERITIPKFGNAESLNVASAFAAIMGYLRKDI
jgi:TrmH family RNA methyltransferase